MRKLLVFLVLLVIAVGIADRALLYAAENELARRVSQQYPMDAEPEVDIGGFPFLHQAITGRYQEINVVTGAFSFNELQFERVDVTLSDVEAPLSEMLTSPSVVAGSAEGSVLVPYSEFQRRLPEGITIEQEDGQPRIAGDLAIQGFSVPVESGIEIAVSDSTLSLTPTDVEVGDSVIDASGVANELSFQYPVEGLPFGLDVTSVEAQPNGVEIAVQGSDVDITAPSPAE